MTLIAVHFYEDILTIYKTVRIQAFSKRDFESKLRVLMEDVRHEADLKGIELAGINYKLPDEWQ